MLVLCCFEQCSDAGDDSCAVSQESSICVRFKPRRRMPLNLSQPVKEGPITKIMTDIPSPSWHVPFGTVEWPARRAVQGIRHSSTEKSAWKGLPYANNIPGASERGSADGGTCNTDISANVEDTWEGRLPTNPLPPTISSFCANAILSRWASDV